MSNYPTLTLTLTGNGQTITLAAHEAAAVVLALMASSAHHTSNGHEACADLDWRLAHEIMPLTYLAKTTEAGAA